MVTIRNIEYLVKLFMYNKAIERFNTIQDIRFDKQDFYFLLALYKGNSGYGMNICQMKAYLSSYSHTRNRKIIADHLKYYVSIGLCVKNRRIYSLTYLGKAKIKELEGCIRSVRMRS